MTNVGDSKGGRPHGLPPGRSGEAPGRIGKGGGELPSQAQPQPQGDPAASLPDPDGYGLGGKPTVGNVPTPVKTVQALLPDLALLENAADVPPRFAADLKLLFAQLNAPNLSPSERAQRVFEFFAKYAEVFVKLVEQAKEGQGQQPKKPQGPQDPKSPPAAHTPQAPQKAPLPQAAQKAAAAQLFPGLTVQETAAVTVAKSPPVPLTKEALKQAVNTFSRTLSENGFETFKAGAKFPDAKAAALALLHAATPAEVRQLAKEAQVSATVYPPGSQEAQKAPSDRPDAARAAAEKAQLPRELMMGVRGDLKINPFAAENVKNTPVRAPDGDPYSPRTAGRTDKVLGSNMLWNVLHKFRGDNPDDAMLQDNWDKLTFGAVMFLVLFALAVVALVSL